MLPRLSDPFRNPSGNHLQNNGTAASATQQIMGYRGNFCPNPMQIQPQFQIGTFNPQLVMPPFPNPGVYFASAQLFPFPQSNMQNISSNMNQILPHNVINQHQFLSNGQFNSSNLAQNSSLFLQMQMQNSALQNFQNIQANVGNGNVNLHHTINENASKQINSNAPTATDFGGLQHNYMRGFIPAAKSQGNSGDFKEKKSNWRQSCKKNLRPQNRNQRFHTEQNLKGFCSENQGKGYKKAGTMISHISDTSQCIQMEKKRSLLINYTEQEIQQWREQRRKNYPSKANVEKRLKDCTTRLEPSASTAKKIRCQQLKEILEKQAELGCEVAEIPSCYLLDSERQTERWVNNQKNFGKRERFRNKFDRKKKHHQNDQQSVRDRLQNGVTSCRDHEDQVVKKQRLASDGTVNENKVQPSLLQKLLHSDIKRDKKHLLQVFRFMVMNSFFEIWPQKSLKFPVVAVKESGDESSTIEEKEQLVCGGLSDSPVFDKSANDNGNEAEVLSRNCRGIEFLTKTQGKRPQEEGEIVV